MPQEFAFPNTEASVWLARTDCFLIVKLKGTQMRNDPRQITARFGKCAKCGNDVKIRSKPLRNVFGWTGEAI